VKNKLLEKSSFGLNFKKVSVSFSSKQFLLALKLQNHFQNKAFSYSDLLSIRAITDISNMLAHIPVELENFFRFDPAKDVCFDGSQNPFID
jgi:hypothetical protein